MKVSVIIIALNECRLIRRAIESCRQVSDDVVVIDGGSTDATVDVSLLAGARVLENRFISYGEQLRYGFENASFRNRWVFRLDADEYISRDLEREIVNCTSNLLGFKAGSVRRHIYFMGERVRYGGIGRMKTLRLVDSKSVEINSRPMDERFLAAKGTVFHFNGAIVDDRDESIEQWSIKHLRYIELEVASYFLRRQDPKAFAETKEKKVYYALPPFLRVLMYFTYRYIIRLGFLDRASGRAYHFLQAMWFRYLIDLEITKQGFNSR